MIFEQNAFFYQIGDLAKSSCPEKTEPLTSVSYMTTKGRSYPTRISCKFKGKSGQIVLDQLRTVDSVRLVRKLGRISQKAASEVLVILQEMFTE